MRLTAMAAVGGRPIPAVQWRYTVWPSANRITDVGI